jgi:hypothetical protein
VDLPAFVFLLGSALVVLGGFALRPFVEEQVASQQWANVPYLSAKTQGRKVWRLKESFASSRL